MHQRSPIAIVLTAALAAAQAAAVVDDQQLEATITAACGTLREQKQLVPFAELRAGIAVARGCELPVVPLRTEALPPPDLHDRLRASLVIVGQFYECTECDEWHFNGSSGFWVGATGELVTCMHVLAEDPETKTPFLVAADLDGHVWPVTKVLAADARHDCVVLATKAEGRTPLPLGPEARVGERVYCLSSPDHNFGFFSEGMVARAYATRVPLFDDGPVPPPGAAHDPVPVPDPKVEPVRVLHVSCEFGKGSSGAPIVDQRGNVVAFAQSTTTLVYDEDADVVDTQMVFKTAVPAAVVRRLVGQQPPK